MWRDLKCDVYNISITSRLDFGSINAVKENITYTIFNRLLFPYHIYYTFLFIRHLITRIIIL